MQNMLKNKKKGTGLKLWPKYCIETLYIQSYKFILLEILLSYNKLCRQSFKSCSKEALYSCFLNINILYSEKNSNFRIAKLLSVNQKKRLSQNHKEIYFSLLEEDKRNTKISQTIG